MPEELGDIVQVSEVARVMGLGFIFDTCASDCGVLAVCNAFSSCDAVLLVRLFNPNVSEHVYGPNGSEVDR